MEQGRTPELTTRTLPSPIMEHYAASFVQMLSHVGYEDTNYSSEERQHNVDHVYSNTIAYFVHPSRRLRTGIRRMQAFIQTIVRMTVYTYPKLPLGVMTVLCIYYTYTVTLDDCEDHPAACHEDLHCRFDQRVRAEVFVVAGCQ